MLFGTQLFGISKIFNSDPEGTLKRLSDAGYSFIEPCVAFSDLGGFEKLIWTPQSAEEYSPLLAKYNLSISSCHIFAADILAETDAVIAFGKKFGVSQFVMNCPQEITLETYSAYAELCSAVADKLSAAGMELLLHNNYLEISTKLKGKTAYEWLIEKCGGKVGMQPDVGWVQFGGVDPEAFLWRNAGHISSIHYKDVKGDCTEMPADESGICLGKGKLDAEACFQFARYQGITQLVDQDMSDGDILNDLAEAVKLLKHLGQSRGNSTSHLNILDTESGEITELAVFDDVIEAPNALNDGDTLMYNSNGGIWKFSISKKTCECIDTGICDNCNNDHVLSPDNTEIAVSNSSFDGGNYTSLIYILPINGGTPRQITPTGPSYLHGWSPDGEELAYCAFRMVDGKMSVDVYSIPAAGGEEKRLTSGEGFSDGPEYSPDGRHIWFNSTRSGLMQAWRMNRDGSSPEQMTDDESNAWFPHVSPDGQKVVYLTYRKGDLEPQEHLPNMQVELWLMDYDGGNKRKLLSFLGGQGSINVASWLPDSRKLAFVSYNIKHS